MIHHGKVSLKKRSFVLRCVCVYEGSHFFFLGWVEVGGVGWLAGVVVVVVKFLIKDGS